MAWDKAGSLAVNVAMDLIKMNRGNSHANRYNVFLNNRAYQTQWDQWNAEHNRALHNDLVSQSQFDRAFGHHVADTDRKFNRTAMENDRSYNRGVYEFNLNRQDRQSEYDRSMAWSREQYDRAELERSRKIQTAVADATKAGVHPLFALGASPGFSGGSSLPSGGSPVPGGSSGGGYASSGGPSPQGPGGTVAGSAGAAGLQAISSGAARMGETSHFLGALRDMQRLKASEAQDALYAAKTAQEIKESEHRMKMSEVEAQIGQSQLALHTQRINQTGMGRGATVDPPPKKTNERSKDLVDKKIITDALGRKHNVLSGPFGTKFRFPIDVDIGETGETFAGEAGALAVGIGGVADGMVSTLMDNFKHANTAYRFIVKNIAKVLTGRTK